jgi:intraflagellar transport protein 88
MSAQFDFSKAAQKPPPTSKGLTGVGSGSLGGNPAPFGNNNFGAPQNVATPANQVPGTRGGRLGTMQRQNEHRPITSNKSAGFGNTKQGFNSTLNKFGTSTTKDGEKDKPMEPEKKNKKYEKEIDALIDESAIMATDGKIQEGLVKAKEAFTKLKQLENFLDRNELNEYMNTELFCSVGLNLAVMYEKNELYQEAIQEYTNLTHAKSHESGLESYVRVNMGNIYFKQQNYQMAIRMYKKALDVVLTSVKLSMKYKIMKNLGHSYVKQNQFFDAINVYEEVLDKAPDFETAFNLMICYYTIGDKEKMKNNFHEMLHIETLGDDEEETDLEDPEKKQDDVLAQEIKERKRKASRFILDAAKLIAPVIEEDIIDGYNYIIDILKGSKSKFFGVQSEIEICKANCYINKKQIEKAIETLKAFEKKDKSMMARAATNISFLYFLEGEYPNSEKYADMALNYDRYNAKALVNKGNCLFAKNDFLRAKENYLEAIGVEADCVEALYNLALVNKKLNSYMEALTALEKLQTIVSKYPEVVYQMAC